MTDDEIIQSARGMVLSWLGEWALMMRIDQTPDQLGLDAQNRIIDRHIDYLLSVRATLAELWDWPPPPAPFPFQERPRCMEPTCPDFGDPDFGEATCPAEHAADTVTAAMERQAAKRLAHQARLASGETT